MKVRGQIEGDTVWLDEDDMAQVPRRADGSNAAAIEIEIVNLPADGATARYVGATGFTTKAVANSGTGMLLRIGG